LYATLFSVEVLSCVRVAANAPNRFFSAKPDKNLKMYFQDIIEVDDPSSTALPTLIQTGLRIDSEGATCGRVVCKRVIFPTPGRPAVKTISPMSCFSDSRPSFRMHAFKN
jgi:alpha-D-ribose 1-methylphosphonate 5-phosphate C-P lyase